MIPVQFMRRWRRYIIIFLLIFPTRSLSAQSLSDLPRLIVYKKIDSVSLKMEILYPVGITAKDVCPCIIFFFGGGWISGNVDQFRPQANHFVTKGIVCFLADYRVKSRQGTTPFQSLEDAKSAIRFIRKNAKFFHIDANSLIAAGGSAGGQLAAATALVKGYNDAEDDLSISTRPDALILFNPVLDNGPAGYGFERIGEKYKSFSPLHNICKGTPPSIIFLGTRDHLIPVETVEYYKMAIQKTGGRCDLILYEGAGHGFFNKSGYMEATLLQADQFLESLGFIKYDL